MENIKKLDESIMFTGKLHSTEVVSKHLLSPVIGAVIAFVTVIAILFTMNFFIVTFNNPSYGLFHKVDVITAVIVAFLVSVIKILENFRK